LEPLPHAVLSPLEVSPRFKIQNRKSKIANPKSLIPNPKSKFIVGS
jgi:hypothetical protein